MNLPRWLGGKPPIEISEEDRDHEEYLVSQRQQLESFVGEYEARLIRRLERERHQLHGAR